MKYTKFAMISVAAAAITEDGPVSDISFAHVVKPAIDDFVDIKPNDGFYLDMGGQEGLSYLNAKVGEQWLKLGINTCSSDISINGPKCTSKVCKNLQSMVASEAKKNKNAQPGNCVFATSDNHLIKAYLQNSATYKDDILLKSDRYEQTYSLPKT